MTREYQGATILCRDATVDGIRSLVEERAEEVTVVEEDGSWTKITGTFADGQLRVTTMAPMLRREGQQVSDFGRITLGINNLIRNRTEIESEERQALIERVRATQLLIGFGLDPLLIDDGERWDCILAIAQVTDGLVFEGLTLRDPLGEVLIDLFP